MFKTLFLSVIFRNKFVRGYTISHSEQIEMNQGTWYFCVYNGSFDANFHRGRNLNGTNFQRDENSEMNPNLCVDNKKCPANKVVLT